MRRPGHDVYLLPTASRPDQPLNYDWILVALILQEDGILRAVDKLGDALSAVAAAPDQMGLLVPFEGFSVPIRFEAFNNFGDFVSMRGDDRVVACFGQILGVQ